MTQKFTRSSDSVTGPEGCMLESASQIPVVPLEQVEINKCTLRALYWVRVERQSQHVLGAVPLMDLVLANGQMKASRRKARRNWPGKSVGGHGGMEYQSSTNDAVRMMEGGVSWSQHKLLSDREGVRGPFAPWKA